MPGIEGSFVTSIWIMANSFFSILSDALAVSFQSWMFGIDLFPRFQPGASKFAITLCQIGLNLSLAQGGKLRSVQLLALYQVI